MVAGAEGVREELQGFEVGEQRLLQGFGPSAGSGGVPFEAERLEPAALAERLVEREQLQLERTVTVGEQARVGHRLQLGVPRERDVVTRKRLAAVLHRHLPVPEPDGHLAAGQALLGVHPPVLDSA